MNNKTRDQNSFAERLKKARKFRDLGQQKLAELTGLPPSSISHFEADSRKPSFENLRRIATALDVSTDYLLGRTDEMSRVVGAQKLHRDLDKLTEPDLALADDFIKMLAERNKSRTEQDE